MLTKTALIFAMISSCDNVWAATKQSKKPTTAPIPKPSRTPVMKPSKMPVSSPSKKPIHNPTFKPSKAKPSQKPSFTPSVSPVTSKPTFAPSTFEPSFSPSFVPTVYVKTTDSKNIADINNFYPVNGTNGLLEQEYFSCPQGKKGSNAYSMYGNKVNNVIMGFGLICSNNMGKWRVLGNSAISGYKYNWGPTDPITSVTVYKLLNSTLGEYIVSSVTVSTSVPATATTPAAEVTKGFSLNQKCKEESDICQVHTYTAPAGQALTNWYFKTLLTQAQVAGSPGVILDIKVSATPLSKASSSLRSH